MSASRRRFGSLSAALVVLALVTGCAPSSTSSPSSPSLDGERLQSTGSQRGTAAETGSLVIVGRIVTMDEPPVAEALLIEDGTVAAVGTRDEVLALAGDDVPVIDIGENVAYPGFIDAHAHWIGDRELLRDRDAGGGHGRGHDAAAGPRSPSSGSTRSASTSSRRLAADDALPLRVDAYLALNFDNGVLRGLVRRSRSPAPSTTTSASRA